jgi:transcriptional regulator with XRE-family HTH domain
MAYPDGMSADDYGARVAARVRAELAAQHITQQAVAARLGIHASQVSARLGRAATITLDVREVAIIAAMTGLQPGDLMPDL